MSSYNYQEPSPITSPTMLKLQRQVANLKKRIEREQTACEHDWETISASNDHDGWSFVIITWSERRHCKKCDLYKSFVTSQAGPSCYA